ncbi:MAG: hypothetical protein HYT79_11725 [Elusimicrobia bacterium]|nr:hypothetical protein [Elusimicrobiota bacterium]
MNSRGQILVPSLFIFPGLFLFAILIFEVAKLSQQKILMQFAMDTSAFMEASQLSDAANRFAYLNSPWPTRVFQAKGEDFELVSWPTPGGGTTGKDPSLLWYFLLKNGVYPGSLPASEAFTSLSANEDPAELGVNDPWQGQFCIGGQPAADGDEFTTARCGLNLGNPPKDLGTWVLFTKGDLDKSPGGLSGILKQEDAEQVYAMVGEVYGYFHSLATMVRLVYMKLNKVFFKKTFWLNTGFNPSDETAPPHLLVTEHCTSKVTSYFTKMISGPLTDIPDTRRWEPTPITFGGQSRCDGGSGIWQLSTVRELSNGSHILTFGKHYYTGPENHFGIDYRDLFDGENPFVTASAEVSGGRIWPQPKPSFQVRLRP